MNVDVICDCEIEDWVWCCLCDEFIFGCDFNLFGFVLIIDVEKIIVIVYEFKFDVV